MAIPPTVMTIILIVFVSLSYLFHDDDKAIIIPSLKEEERNLAVSGAGRAASGP
jgi:hypothetical protein